jgi:uncharacterized protein
MPRRRRGRSFDVPVQDMVLRITGPDDRYEEARATGMQVWEQIQAYAIRHPAFRWSRRPVSVPMDAPAVAREMATEAALAGVGPMFAFRGALTDVVGRALAADLGDVIVSCGADHFVRTRHRARMGVGAPTASRAPFGVVVDPSLGAHGILATTDARWLPADTLDGIVVVARSCMLADAAAAAASAILRRPRSFRAALAHLQSIEGLRGAMLMKGSAIGVTGALELAA